MLIRVEINLVKNIDVAQAFVVANFAGGSLIGILENFGNSRARCALNGSIW